MNLTRRQVLTAGGLLLGGSLLRVQAQGPLYCPILMYHHVGYAPENADAVLRDLVVSPELFSEHLATMQTEGYVSVTMAELFEALAGRMLLPEKPVILTFDDGYSNMYEHALPRLLEKGMKGLFYLISGRMDQPSYLTWGQAAELKAAGMEIGNHTKSHPDLGKLGYSEQLAEIEEAAAAIGATLGERPKFFCYPLGHYNNDTKRIVEETGHLTATTISDGTLQYASSKFELRRVRIRNTTNTASLRWLLDRRV
jgi:peptidoglycan/xylan/chitin deacetylase (PgdA/CDA1 family)